VESPKGGDDSRSEAPKLSAQVPLLVQVPAEEVARLEQKWPPVGSTVEVCYVPDDLIGTAALQRTLDERVQEMKDGGRKISELRHILCYVGLLMVWLAINGIIHVPLLGPAGAVIFWLVSILPAAIRTYLRSAQLLEDAEALTISSEFTTGFECIQLPPGTSSSRALASKGKAIKVMNPLDVEASVDVTQEDLE